LSFRDTIPIVLALRSKHLKAYHWVQIRGLLGAGFELTPELTLKNLLDMQAQQFQAEISEIAG